SHLSGTQVVVLMVGQPGQAPAAVVKMPSTSDGVASQRREAEALAALRSAPALGDLAALIPGRLAEGELGGVAYTVERAVPGVEGRVLLGGKDPAMKERVVAAAEDVIRRLHRATATTAVVDDEPLERWVGARVRLLAPASRNAPARELGPVVQSLLAGDAGELAGGVDRETLLLVWLRRVAYNLTQSPGDARNWIWTSRNVDQVLRSL